MASLGFSYAQAAKGLAPSSNVSSNPGSSASSEHGIRDAAAADGTNSQAKTSRGTTKPERTSSASHRLSQTKPDTEENAPEKDKLPPRTADAAEVDVKATQNQITADDQSTPVSKAVATPASSVSNTEGTESKVQHFMSDSDGQDKAKETDDDWEKVSIPSSIAEKELKAAPIPTVNYWTQRSQLLQTKLKEQVSQRQIPAPIVQPKSRPQTASSDDSRRKAGTRDNGNIDLHASTLAKGTANSRAAKEQQSGSTTARPTSQHNENSVLQPPPPAVDAQSWPTPESAIVDPGRRSSTKDQSERGEMTDAKTSSRKNQWTALPFVPSVKFETQIPAARRGGRPANGRGRGGMNTQAERGAEKVESGSMGPPPKVVADQDRGRKGASSQSVRASSVPKEHPPGKPDNQQLSSSTTFVKNAGVVPDSLPSTAVHDRVMDTKTPPSQALSRSSSRHTAHPSDSKGPKPESDISHNSGITESPTRHSQGERGRTVNVEAHRNGAEPGEKAQNKDWQKERANNAQKSENWRVRGERPERGRGNYRGRGNHTSHNNSSFTAPLPQHGFDANKQGSPSDVRNRQPSHPYGSPFASTRSNPRSQSIPIQMLQSSFYQPAQAFPQNLPAIQTEMNYGGYGPVQGGVMSAMPYNEPLNGFALLSMVVTQLEYYFSLDNLCKDMYLRKNMDSQGYVSLRVIADFRRIRALLGDSSMSYDQLRSVAQQARNIDYVVGEEDEDRLRSRGNWKDFVLPMEERLPGAQNDGPKTKPDYPRHSTGIAPDFQMSNGLRSAPPNVNGFQETFSTNMQFHPGPVAEPQSTEQWASRVEHTRREDDRRTSVASPVSKMQSPTQEPRTVFGSMTNGHRDSMSSNTTGKESSFPDESVAVLKVVVKDPDFQGAESTSVEEPVSERVSGLRGGAGSPEQTERMRTLQLGHGLTPSKSKDQPIYFTQDEGLPPPHLVRPGYIHEDYLSLREKAISQRAENHFDGASVVLYPLWAEFLPVSNQFNVNMYEDFKIWALEDQEKGNENGKNYLVKFYDAMLGGKTAMSERVASDIVTIARKEPASDRPVWLKLRTAWRNGATNMKTRKRLTDLLTADERAELDRGK